MRISGEQIVMRGSHTYREQELTEERLQIGRAHV